MVAKMLGIPNFSVLDDPRKGVFQLAKMSADAFYLPPFANGYSDVSKFNALKEWAYLSPVYFKHDKNVLKDYDLPVPLSVRMGMSILRTSWASRYFKTITSETSGSILYIWLLESDDGSVSVTTNRKTGDDAQTDDITVADDVVGVTLLVRTNYVVDGHRFTQSIRQTVL